MCVGECKHSPKSLAKFKQVSNFDSQQIDTMKSEIQKNNMKCLDCIACNSSHRHD